jgi:fructose-bisphosphate aldolase class II
MYDGSMLPFEQNAANSRVVVEMAEKCGASVEAEIGAMGSEEFASVGDSGHEAVEAVYTDPDQAAKFVRETGVDCLACSFGTVHGIYKTTPKLSFDVIERVRNATNSLPLVMHGGSGITDDDYREAMTRGIRKVNYYTYGALAGGRAVYDLVRRTPEGLQFHDVSVAATDAIADDIRRVIKVLSRR